MKFPARPRSGLPFSLRRIRRVVIACLVTILTGVALLVLIGLVQWRGRQAIQGDTHSVIAQAAQQLVRTFRSRRGTLTFVGDILNRRSDLTSPQLQAMGASAVQHTRHLLAIGLVRANQPPDWWSSLRGIPQSDIETLNRTITQRTRLKGVWTVPSTLVQVSGTQKKFLVFLEPLRTPSLTRSALVGLYDLESLLRDFFENSLGERHPVELLAGNELLYHSASWQLNHADHRSIIAEYPVELDAERWTIRMQPESTRVVETLSWFNVLLISLAILTGCGFIIIVWILVARAWILQRTVARRTAALRRTSQRLRQMAITDELTGLYNRRFFFDRWEWECDRAKRYHRPLTCLMIDVNGFKQVNDRLGHHVGDTVLRQVAQELKVVLRQSDVLARFGGDEFIVALPETSLDQAALVVQKLRQIIIPIPQGPDYGVPSVSLSVGMSCIERGTETAQELLEAADQSLYSFKRHGREVGTDLPRSPAEHEIFP